MAEEITSPRVYDAPNMEQGPLPAYKVIPVEGVAIEKEICTFNEKTKEIERSQKIFDKGYMVFFPRGHSNFYESIEALKANGFGEIVPLIKMDQDSEMSPDHQPPTVRRRFGKE